MEQGLSLLHHGGSLASHVDSTHMTVLSIHVHSMHAALGGPGGFYLSLSVVCKGTGGVVASGQEPSGCHLDGKSPDQTHLWASCMIPRNPQQAPPCHCLP